MNELNTKISQIVQHYGSQGLETRVDMDGYVECCRYPDDWKGAGWVSEYQIDASGTVYRSND